MDWSTTDYALLAGALAATHADLQSTKELLRRGDTETNPILGDNPSKADVNKYFAVSTLGGLLAANALPAKYRKGLLGAWAGLETRLAYQNQHKRIDRHDGFASAMRKPALAALAGGLLAHHFLNDEDDGSEKITLGALGPLSLKYEKKF